MHFLPLSLRWALAGLLLSAGLASAQNAWQAPWGGKAANVVKTEQVQAELLVHAPQGLAAGRPMWLQLGVRHDAALQQALEAGLVAVQDRCLKIDHRQLHG